MNYFESSGVIGKWVLGIIFFSPLLIAIRSHFIAKHFTSDTVGYGFAVNNDLRANQDHFVQDADFYRFEDENDRTSEYQSDIFEWNSFQNDYEINPATGLIMIGDLDMGGSAYVFSDQVWDHSFDDSHHSSWD